MRKKTVKAKPRPKQDQAEFERKVAELGRAQEKLPADRQEEPKRNLERERICQAIDAIKRAPDENADGPLE